MSRLRANVETIFDVFVEVAAPVDPKQRSGSFILLKYPPDYDDEKFTQNILDFAFPCEMSSDSVQPFSFVLTGEDGSFTYGYARYTPRNSTCLCLLSALPWTSLFYRFLNHMADVMNTSEPSVATALLVNAYHQEVPLPGESWSIESSIGRNKLEIKCPDHTRLPRIPDDPNLTEYYNAVDEEQMMSVFASMLCERRIIFTCRKIKVLTACVMAANMLIFPMSWQHIFIPVLPSHLSEMLCAPMPFLIGVPKVSMKLAMRSVDLSEVVILDIDEKTFYSPFSDFDELPFEVLTVLRKNLRNSSQFGDGVARSFLRALVVLIGGYREALQFHQGEDIKFNRDMFVETRNPSIRPFLENMLHLQIFDQFVDKRLIQLNLGEEITDEFEEECRLYSGQDFNKYKHQYATWKESLTGRFSLKEGEKVVKMLRTKVRNKSKEALRDFRIKMGDIKDDVPTFKSNAMPGIPAGRDSIKKMMKNRNAKFRSKEWAGSAVDMNPVDEVGTDVLGLPTSQSKSDINLVEELQTYFDSKSESLLHGSKSEEILDKSRSLNSSPAIVPTANDLFGPGASTERPASSLTTIGIQPPPPTKQRHVVGGGPPFFVNPAARAQQRNPPPPSPPTPSKNTNFSLAGMDLGAALFGDDVGVPSGRQSRQPAANGANFRTNHISCGTTTPSGVQISHYLNEFRDLKMDTSPNGLMTNNVVQMVHPQFSPTNSTFPTAGVRTSGVSPTSRPPPSSGLSPAHHPTSPVTSPSDLIDLGPEVKPPPPSWNFDEMEFDPLKISSTQSSPGKTNAQATTSSYSPNHFAGAISPAINSTPAGGAVRSSAPPLAPMKSPGTSGLPSPPGTKTAVCRLRPGTSNNNWNASPGLGQPPQPVQQRVQPTPRSSSIPPKPSLSNSGSNASTSSASGLLLRPAPGSGNTPNGTLLMPTSNGANDGLSMKNDRSIVTASLSDGANWEQFE